MNAHLSLEPKMIHTFWHDGLVDILLGFGLVLIGVAWHFDLVALGPIAPALLVPLWGPIRVKFIEPRLGFAKFTQEREKKNRQFLSSMVLIGLFTLGLGVAVYFFTIGKGLGEVTWIAALPALLLAAPVLATGVLIKSRRFFLYAGILILAGVLVAVTQLGPSIGLWVPGVFILLWGILLMIHFFKETTANIKDKG